MKRVTYTDAAGRRFATLVPEGREEDAAIGVPVGPPDLSSLELPLELEVRLNNELFRRELFETKDIRGRPQEVLSALQAAYRADAARVMNLYNGRTP